MKEVEKTSDEVTALCSDLVKFNSAHPEARTDECVEYIRDYLTKHGIENEIHSRNISKPNIVAQIKGSGTRKILWVGHLDVVPEGKAEMWTYPPYSGKITDDGYIWGRGTSDMKGACASAMVSARVLNDLDELDNTVEFWFTADEEIGGRDGARWLAESGQLKGDVCVIGDGYGGGLELPSIDLGCKGGAGTKLIARGKTAHGSTPFLGDNAITKLIKVIPWVEKIADYKLELPKELELSIDSSLDFYKATQKVDTDEQRLQQGKMFHYPTVACNIINGGVKTNVVPDYAEADFDIRLTPGCNPLKVKERIEELVEQAGVPGVEALVRAGASAGYYESPNSIFAKKLSESIEHVTLKKPIFKILTGGTDAVSIKRFTGIPCLGYGTSLVGMAHQPNERVSIENLLLGVKVYTSFPFFYGA